MYQVVAFEPAIDANVFVDDDGSCYHDRPTDYGMTKAVAEETAKRFGGEVQQID